MSVYDLIMAAIIIVAIVQGARRGAAMQIAPIVSLVLGYVVALPLSKQLAPWFGSEAPMNRYIALLVVYLAVSLSVYLLARSFKDYILKFQLHEYDRHLGSILGGVKGLLVCLFLTFFLVSVSPASRESILQSHTGAVATVVMNQLHPVMPAGIHELLHPYIHTLDEANGTTVHAGYEHLHMHEEAHEREDGLGHESEHGHADGGAEEPGDRQSPADAVKQAATEAALDFFERMLQLAKQPESQPTE